MHCKKAKKMHVRVFTSFRYIVIISCERATEVHTHKLIQQVTIPNIYTFSTHMYTLTHRYRHTHTDTHTYTCTHHSH